MAHYVHPSLEPLCIAMEYIGWKLYICFHMSPPEEVAQNQSGHTDGIWQHQACICACVRASSTWVEKMLTSFRAFWLFRFLFCLFYTLSSCACYVWLLQKSHCIRFKTELQTRIHIYNIMLSCDFSCIACRVFFLCTLHFVVAICQKPFSKSM